LLYLRAGQVCSRDDMIKAVWPEVLDPGAISDANIDQLVRRVRLKIEPDPSNPARLVLKKAFGYMLV
jgi:DNA-binding response OmpR family regulator